MKRFLALLMVLLMTVTLLAACGKKETPAEGGAAAVGYMEGGNAEQIALFGDLTGTKLRVADDVALQEWEEAFYKQLEEETGMIVEIEPMSSAELTTKIAQAVAAGDTRNYFDVGVLQTPTFLNIVYGSQAIPLDQYIYYDDPVWKYDDATDFNSLELFKHDGHYWGAPSHGFHETFIFYNKTYFEEVGAPDPYEEYYLKDNWTFETFLDTCKAVTKKNDDGEVETYAWATWNYFSFCAAAGNDMIAYNGDKNAWEIVFDQPNGIAGLNVYYESVINDYVLIGSSGHNEFVNRKVVMHIDKPSGTIGPTNIYERSSDEICMVPFPKMDASQEKYISPMTVSGYHIASCAQNPAGAAAYIYYHRLGEQNRDASEVGRENQYKTILNKESQERRKEYIAKCDFSTFMIDGLNGWYSGTRDTFLNIMRKERKNPATAVDTMKGLVRDAMRQTGL